MFASVFALLFILKLKFNRNNGLPTYINSKYGRSHIITFRKIEKLTGKKEKLRLDLLFLKTCKFHDIYPKFLYFKLYNSRLYRTRFYLDCLDTLLDNEIKTKERDWNNVSKLLLSTLSNFNKTLTFLERVKLKSHLEELTKKVLEQVCPIHEDNHQSLVLQVVSTRGISAEPWLEFWSSTTFEIFQH